MLGFIGCGNMAQAMLKGILQKGLYQKDQIIVSRRNEEALAQIHRQLGVETTTDNRKVAEKADVLVLAGVYTPGSSQDETKESEDEGSKKKSD